MSSFHYTPSFNGNHQTQLYIFFFVTVNKPKYHTITPTLDLTFKGNFFLANLTIDNPIQLTTVTPNVS